MIANDDNGKGFFLVDEGDLTCVLQCSYIGANREYIQLGRYSIHGEIRERKRENCVSRRGGFENK